MKNGSFMACSAALVAMLFAVPASADTTAPARIGVGVTAGSLGIGPEVSYAITKQLAVRGNITFLDISHTFNSGDVSYNGSAHLGSGGLMLDYHPGGSGWFLSAGARVNKNKVRANATPPSSATINGTYYTSAQVGTLNATADFAPLAPTLSAGYSGQLKHGLHFGIEAGAMFGGGARMQPITASGGGIAQADLDQERANLQNDVNKYKVYPILQLSLGYRF